VVGKKIGFSLDTPTPVNNFISAKGQCTVAQSFPPTVAGIVQGEPSVSQIYFYWTPTTSNIANMVYYFCYTSAAIN
jgi:hypothetical protein